MVKKTKRISFKWLGSKMTSQHTQPVRIKPKCIRASCHNPGKHRCDRCKAVSRVWFPFNPFKIHLRSFLSIICPLFQICPLLLSIYFNLSIFLSIFSKKCWLFNFLAVFHFLKIEFPLFKKIQNIFIKLSKVILKSSVTFKLLIQSSSVLSFWRPQNVKLRIG